MQPAGRIRVLRSRGEHEAALHLAVGLAGELPEDAEIQYEAASVHDFLGHEAAAVPYYCAAIAAGLSGDELRGAYLGLGSTYRVLGRTVEALATFDEGLRRFPGARELVVFRAMALYNAGRAREAVAALLGVVVETSGDPELQRYARALTSYAANLDPLDVDPAPPRSTSK